MKRYKIFKLVSYVAYSCNMSCKGCLAISDIPRNGVPDFEMTMQSIRDWSQVLDPDWVVPLGGEPLLNPRIKEILLEMRRCWPKAKISFCTNGLLLRRIIDKDFLEQVKPIEIRISLHKQNEEGKFFKDIVKDLLALYPKWHKNSFDWGDELPGLPADHKTDYLYSFSHDTITVSVSTEDTFVVPYRLDEQGRMRPYNNDPVEAYKRCINLELPVLYENHLWRCIPYPNLKDAVADFEQHWPSYKPYKVTDDLTEFFVESMKAHEICRMCPTWDDPVLKRTPDTIKILPNPNWIKKQIENK